MMSYIRFVTARPHWARLAFGAIATLLFSATIGNATTISTPDPPFKGSPNALPFGADEDVRYQSVYDSSVFPAPFRIESLAFIPASSDSPAGGLTYQVNIEIRAGLTQMPVDGLSTDLDSNIDGVQTIIFSDPNYSTSLVPETPSLIFDLMTPFTYDPASGKNLLLEIYVTGGTSNGRLGARTKGDSGVVSRAFDWDINGGLISAGDLGLVTHFTGSIVPEPSSCAAIFGVGLLLIMRRDRRNAA